MPPFDWSNIARRDEVAHRSDMDARFELMDRRFELVDLRCDHIDQRLGRLEDGQTHLGLRLDAVNDTLQKLSLGGLGLIVTLILGFSSIFAAVILSA